ncbi:hypothetical protein BAT_3756 [Bacillus pumilus ATCC 7061]|nr:hypothetical protein BAT_3756 [Bacillus pumilus ATCC 7061]
MTGSGRVGLISSYEYKKNLFIYFDTRKAILFVEWLVLIG